MSRSHSVSPFVSGVVSANRSTTAFAPVASISRLSAAALGSGAARELAAKRSARTATRIASLGSCRGRPVTKAINAAAGISCRLSEMDTRRLKQGAAPFLGRPLHRRDRGALGDEPIGRDLIRQSVKTPSGANLDLKAPGRLRPRLETMRHWTTSFQLLKQDPQYGAVARESQMAVLLLPTRVDLPRDRDHLRGAVVPPPATAIAPNGNEKTPMPSDSPGPIIRPLRLSRRA